MLPIKINNAVQEAQAYCLSFLQKIIRLHFYNCLRGSQPSLLLPVPSLGSQNLLVLLCTADPNIFTHMTPPRPQ